MVDGLWVMVDGRSFPVIIHESEYGFDVHCPTLPGCTSQGDTYDGALGNIIIAVREYLEAAAMISATNL